MLTKEQVIEARKHQAEHHGTTFDPSSVTSGMTFYRVEATGVVILD